MAFYSYQPNYYPSNYGQMNNNINWVQGAEGAKAYPVGANNSVLLMDSENQVFYIKTADQAGVPSLRVFDYVERTNDIGTQDLSAYVTKKEFDEAMAKLMARFGK